jgi:uncharacterized protein YukE
MGNLTHGMSIADIEALARAFSTESQALSTIASTIDGKCTTSGWRGSDADDFQNSWGTHKRGISLLCSVLEQSSATLIKQAAAQRQASGELDGVLGIGPGTTGPTLPHSPNATEVVESIDELLSNIRDLLGLSEDIWNVLVKSLRIIDPGALKDFGQFLAQNPGILKVFKGIGDLADTLGSVLDITGYVVSFAKDLITHADLPLDERILHAGLVVGLGFAASKGIEWASEKIGTMIGSAIPGPGTAAGWLIGKGIGIAMSEAYEWADKEYGISDKAADVGVDAYRKAKEFAVEATEKIDRVVDNVTEGAENLVEDVKETGEKALHKADEFIDGGVDKIRGWF